MIADWLHSKADFVTIQGAHVTNNRAAYLRKQLRSCDVELFWTASTDTTDAKYKAGVLLIVRKSDTSSTKRRSAMLAPTAATAAVWRARRGTL